MILSRRFIRTARSPRHVRRSSKRQRATALGSAALLTVAALASSAGVAQAATTTLPDGATIGVTIDAPLDGSSVPYGSPVTVTGSANVSQVGGDGGDPPLPNTVLVTAVDLSGSTSTSSGTTTCGDPNYDNRPNQVLDCELAAALTLSEGARNAGTIAEVGAVGFAKLAFAADVSPVSGLQQVTGPTTNLSSGPTSDLDLVFGSMTNYSGGSVGLFTDSGKLQNQTSFSDALHAINEVLTLATSTNRIVVVISDGVPIGGSSYNFGAELAGLPANTTIYAFAVGGGGKCGPGSDPTWGSLQEMADQTGGTCTLVTETGDLPDVLPGIIHPKLTGLSLSVDGGAPTAITNVAPALPQTGPSSVDYTVDTDVLLPGDHQLCVSASGNDSGGSGQAQECASITVEKVASTITTTASPDIELGTGTINDVATVSSVLEPTGEVTFNLYGPDDTECTDEPVFTAAADLMASVNGGQVATSAGFTPSAAGTYRWVAAYVGDDYSLPVTGACGDQEETVTVTKAGTAISTTASQSVVVGDGESITDSAEVSGFDPTGTVTFELFGPDDATCEGDAVFSSTVSLAGDGTATSEAYLPEAAGVYRWIASYSGDANNTAASGACNDTGEEVTVQKASPQISTEASDSVVVGSGDPVFDVATLSETGLGATGTVTFNLYGPGDVNCEGNPTFTSTVPVAGVTAISEPFTPGEAGDYRWIASYSGDSNNNPVSGACNDDGESVIVDRASPTISTTATEFALLEEEISDTAVVAGGYEPSGSVTFALYAADDTDCEGEPVFSSPAELVNGTAASDGFVPATPGLYRWIATYNGDGNNHAVSGVCGDPAEQSVVGKATPILTTQASGDVPVGGSISDTATLTEGRAPTGTVTFLAYGPGDADCTGVPVAASTTSLSNGSATSDPFVATSPGVYRWVASYSGDSMNDAVAGACNDPGESVTVTPQVLTGRAVSLDVTGVSLLGVPITPIHVQDTGHIATTESASYGSRDCIDIDLAIAHATALCSSVVTDAGYPSRSTAKNTVADVSVGVPGLPVIQVKAIESSSTTTCAGSEGSTTIAYLKVGNTVVIGQPTDVAPNTVVLVGALRLVLNEQIAFSTPDEGLTVNAVHATANLLVLKADIVIGSAESDIGNCPVQPAA